MKIKIKNENGEFKEAIIKGLKGDQGEKGEKGDNGDSVQQEAIDDIKSSLEHIMNDLPLFANKQLTNTHKFISKLNDGVSVKVVCQGDSLTHGQDIISTNKRPANSDSTMVTGGSNDVTIGSSTYPETLQSALQEMYGGRVSVSKRGYCGDTVKISNERWTTNPNADIHILMFGTNDSGAYNEVNLFLSDYYDLIKKILNWGSSIVIMTPPKKGGYDYKISLIEEMLKELGKVLNIPVIDTVDFMIGYSNEEIYGSYQEGVHFNGFGYYILGCRIASLLTGNKALFEDNVITSGDVITPMKHLNYNVYSGANKPTFLDYGDRTMWGGNLTNDGGTVLIPPSSSVTFSIKTDCDNMLLVPILTSGTDARCEITLDYNAKQPKTLSSLTDGETQRVNLINHAKGLLFDVGQTQKKPITDFTIKDINNTVLRIIQKGYHTIKVKNVGQSTNLTFDGFICVDLLTFKTINKIKFNGIEVSQNYGISGYDTLGTKRDMIRVSTGVVLGDIECPIVDLKAKDNFFVWSHLLPNHETGQKNIGASWAKWGQGHFENGVSSGGGTTRPSSPSKGMIFFDENLGKPIFYKGSSVWVDANGSTV